MKREPFGRPQQRPPTLLLLFTVIWYQVFLSTRINLHADIRYQAFQISNTNNLYTIISSSSCRAISMDIPDPLSSLLPIVHRFRWVFMVTPRISTDLGSSWSPYLCLSMWRGLPEYITSELVPTSPAVSCMSGSSNFDSFCVGR